MVFDSDEFFFVESNERSVVIPISERFVLKNTLKELDVGWETDNFVII